MARISTILFVLILSSALCRAQQNAPAPLTGEDSVRTLIKSLPEVREKLYAYDSLTKRKQHLIIKITPPDSAVNMYYVQAGYQGSARFQPHFYFYVDLENNMVYVEDFEQGDRTTLEQWRIRRQNKSTP